MDDPQFHFPYELALEVIHHTRNDTPTLLSLSLLGKDYATACHPLLFHSIDLRLKNPSHDADDIPRQYRKIDQYNHLCRILTERPHLAGLTQTLWLPLFDTQALEDRDATILIPQFLGLFKGLTDITLDGRGPLAENTRERTVFALLELLDLRQLAGSATRSLTLLGIKGVPEEFFRLLGSHFDDINLDSTIPESRFLWPGHHDRLRVLGIRSDYVPGGVVTKLKDCRVKRLRLTGFNGLSGRCRPYLDETWGWDLSKLESLTIGLQGSGGFSSPRSAARRLVEVVFPTTPGLTHFCLQAIGKISIAYICFLDIEFPASLRTLTLDFSHMNPSASRSREDDVPPSVEDIFRLLSTIDRVFCLPCLTIRVTRVWVESFVGPTSPTMDEDWAMKSLAAPLSKLQAASIVFEVVGSDGGAEATQEGTVRVSKEVLGDSIQASMAMLRDVQGRLSVRFVDA